MLFWKLKTKRSLPRLHPFRHGVRAHAGSHRLDISLTAARGELWEAPCARRRRRTTNPFRGGVLAINEWCQADGECATVMGSERSSAFSTAKRIRDVPLLSPSSVAGHDFTKTTLEHNPRAFEKDMLGFFRGDLLSFRVNVASNFFTIQNLYHTLLLKY